MRKSKLSSERGAVLVHVALIFIAVMAFSMIVVDYGVMWVSRNQAQNVADAGALAGAVALALDDPSDLSNSGPAKTAARALARSANVFNEVADVQFTDIIFYDDDPSKFPVNCAGARCIRVDVYRNQARNNPLPMFFGMFVGLNEQGVRATATAWAAVGNASRCLKPWAVADKWTENYPPDGTKPRRSQDGDDFDDVVPMGFTADSYIAPGPSDTGTGYTLDDDLGSEVRLKVGSPHDTINPGWFQALDLTGGGGSQYRDNIAGCADVVWKIGDEIPKENGNMVGPTGQGTGDLIDLDPTAEWDSTNKKVINSCAGTTPSTCPGGAQYASSPRIVAVPVFDLAHYMATGGPGNGTVRVVNILGFFVDRVENPQNTVVGYLAAKADLLIAGGGTITPDASFINTIQLVR